MFGWPFVAEPWVEPAFETMDLTSLSRPEHYAGAAAVGFELWSHTPAFARVAESAGATCTLIGRGVPAPFPPPPRQETRDIDVLMLERSHWPDMSRRLAEKLDGLVTLPVSAHSKVLETLARTRVLAHPARVEALSRIGCEARAMGAVPVVLGSNPFAVGIGEEDGVLAVESVEEMPAAVTALVADRDRLELLSQRGIETARAQVAWEPFVERVAAALSNPPADAGRAARAGLGAALAAGGGPGPEHVLAATRAELAQHRGWLEATNSSLSWRLTAPLRAAKRRVRGRPPG
jgi:hypothetical protein